MRVRGQTEFILVDLREEAERGPRRRDPGLGARTVRTARGHGRTRRWRYARSPSAPGTASSTTAPSANARRWPSTCRASAASETSATSSAARRGVARGGRLPGGRLSRPATPTSGVLSSSTNLIFLSRQDDNGVRVGFPVSHPGSRHRAGNPTLTPFSGSAARAAASRVAGRGFRGGPVGERAGVSAGVHFGSGRRGTSTEASIRKRERCAGRITQDLDLRTLFALYGLSPAASALNLAPRYNGLSDPGVRRVPGRRGDARAREAPLGPRSEGGRRSSRSAPA